MNEEEVKWRLCLKDRRHPLWADSYGELEEDQIPEPSGNCMCDNCFYGRTQLAEALLDCMEKSK